MSLSLATVTPSASPTPTQSLRGVGELPWFEPPLRLRRRPEPEWVPGGFSAVARAGWLRTARQSRPASAGIIR